MTKEHDKNDAQSTEKDGANERTGESDDSSGGVRRRSVIAATLGSPALLGLGFGAADHFALPGPSGPAMSGAASPVERAQAGDPVLAQMDSVTSSIGEEPAQGLPMNDYHVLRASSEVFDTLERQPGEQVRVTRGEDTAVFTLAEAADDADAPGEDEDTAEEDLRAAVEFSDQNTDGSTVTVDSARLDGGGFVVIHDSSLLDGEVIPSVIGVSDYLPPGEYEDLTVELDEPLESEDTLIAMPHEDTNDNQSYDFVTSEGEDDGPYANEAGDAIVADAQVTVGEDTENGDGDAEPAEVEFSDQNTDGSTVTVDSARLDEGGFVVIHDSTLLDGEVIPSVIGVSEYLEAGEYEDLEVELDEPLESDDTLIAMPHQDTNDNQSYDFVTSEGEDDGPYANEAGDAIVADAQVTVGEDTNGTDDEDGAENETEGEDDSMAQETGAVVRASTEGKCRLAFYEDAEFDDDRRWGPLRGDEVCDLADEEFEVEINPRVPAEDVDAEQAQEEGDLVETFVEGETNIAVLAPHGGEIQPYTDQQAELMLEAFPDITAWMLQGYGRDTSFYRWFVPSAEMSEASFPGLAQLSEETYDLAVSFNGISGENIYVGGTADESLRQDIADAIEEALPHDGSPVRLAENRYAADSSQTLVNRVTEGESNGVWIGQPIADRRNNWDVIVEAVGSVVGDS